MSGVELHVDLSAIEGIEERIDAILDFNQRDLLDVIGATVESQTRRRISEEKQAPDGERWKAWSDRYAAGRHGGHSLLEGDGSLLHSIGYQVGNDHVWIGSNLIYAAVHQFGSGEKPVNVPAHRRRVTSAFGKTLPSPVWADVSAYSFLQNIPARPYLGLSVDDEAEIEATIMDWFKEILR